MNEKTKPLVKWIRATVAVRVFDTASHVKARFGLRNMPLTWTYILHFLLWDKDPEQLVQDMAESMHVELPPLEDTTDG